MKRRNTVKQKNLVFYQALRRIYAPTERWTKNPKVLTLGASTSLFLSKRKLGTRAVRRQFGNKVCAQIILHSFITMQKIKDLRRFARPREKLFEKGQYSTESYGILKSWWLKKRRN